jgi:DNA polymerase-3 subunit beta
MISTWLPIIVALAVAWVMLSSDATAQIWGVSSSTTDEATMKFRCSRYQMLAALHLVNTAVAGHDHRPVLHNIKAIATDDHCSLLATDTEIGIKRDVPGVPVEESGEALLPAGRTLAIFREAQDEELTIETSSQTTTVRGGTTEFELGSEDPSAFPEFPSINEDGYAEISSQALKTLMRRTLFAAAIESPRYAITGTLWEIEANTIRLVATDGRRLAIAEAHRTCHGNPVNKGIHVVPTKAMHLLEKNLPDSHDLVRITLRPNEALFQTGQATIYSRLVEGRFPAYKDVLPKKTPIKVPLVAGPFHSSIRQAAVMTEQETKRVVCSFKPKILVLEAQSPDAGRSHVELPIDYAGKPVEINFHPKNLSDFLRALNPSDELTLSMTDGKSPGLFRLGDTYSYLVMPLV